MRRVCRLLYLKNCLNCNTRSSYSSYLKQKRLDLPSKHASSSTQNRALSSTSSQPNIDTDLKQLLAEFPEPKKLVWRVINEAFVVHGNSDVKPQVTVHQIECDNDQQKMWQVTIAMKWPEKFNVEGISRKKADAETISFLYACQKLKNLGLLDNENNPTLPERVQILNDGTLNTSKGFLSNIFQRIWIRYGRKDYIPKFENSQIQGIFGKENYWKSRLTLLYPEEKVFEARSSRLKEAEGIASAKALYWLQERGVINKKKHLVHYSQDEEAKLLRSHSMPYSICIPDAVYQKFGSDFNQFKIDISRISTNIVKTKIEECTATSPTEIYDVITDEKYCEPSEEEALSRSREMYEGNVSFFENGEPAIQEIRRTRSLFPIADKRTDILQMLDENQIVVLSGETGCGKTTQVPQYILEDYSSKMKGSHCNIVVTQPRRISAVSIAERVASERNEKIGETIGYHVRLNKELPKARGAILYCSTGMLLRKLCSNPNLEGVSHIIVDEVHERNIQIDFLLILLKRLLEHNKDIKILMMSASFNTSIFSQYFKCPVIHVSGKVYPVKEYFLEDLLADVGTVYQITRRDPFLNPDLVVNVINHIHASQRPGAILCFLPGWHEILTVQNKLLESFPDETKVKIFRAHSRLPIEEQKLIFDNAPKGVRKVILATDVAETSITINDVVFVVNSGLHKGTSFDSENGVASLSTQWITKANVRQRRGRAGRVQSGVCYNLFTRKILMEMDDYPMPELLRMPLEKVILDCKLYCPNSKAEDFLSLALQPPSRCSVQTGVNELQMLGVLDENENLTYLGEIIVNFATHPRLSIALLYGAFLGCLDPVLTICAILTFAKEPFVNTLEEKSVIKEIKQKYDNFLFSDHLALSKLFDEWTKLSSEAEIDEFLKQHLLDAQNLNFVRELKALFSEELHSAGVISEKNAYLEMDNKCNQNSNHVPSIFAALSAAFFPNVIKLQQGEISHGKINRDAIICSLLKGQKGYIQKESVAANEHEFPSPLFVYFSALQSEARRLMMTSAVSSVPGICLLMFAGQQLHMSEANSDDSSPERYVTLMLDDYKKLTFSCTKQDADFLIECRNHLRDIFNLYIKTLNLQQKEANENVKSLIYDNFLPILKDVISTPQVPFTKGQFYKFVNKSLVVEELW